MSNNTRNVYNKVEPDADNDEIEMLLSSSDTSQQMLGHHTMTTINIENEMTPRTNQHLQRQQIRRENNPTRINMESNANQETVNGGENQNIDDRQRGPNLFAMLREAHHQFNRSQSVRDNPAYPNGANANTRSRTWRENLYQVLSSPASPHAHTSVLRAIFTPLSNLRIESYQTNVLFPGDEFGFTLNQQNISQPEGELPSSSRRQHSYSLESQSSSSSRLSRQSSRLTDDISLNENSPSEAQTPIDISHESNGTGNEYTIRQSMSSNSSTNNGLQRQVPVYNNATAPTVEVIDDIDPNAVGEIIFKIVTHFIRYLPFIFIVFVKFIHDHLLAILDIFVLQGVIYHLNNSIKDQVAKLNQKKLAVLMRDLVLVVCVVMYRFFLSTSNEDPFGLLINPPGTIIPLDLLATQKTDAIKDVSSNVPISLFENEMSSTAAGNSFNNTISITKTISLGTLLYYVAVNDLILKLITQLIKIIVTIFPTKVIRHKSRARLYALIENISQFYRALVPIRQWLRFLFESYTGFEVISGILFSSFYVGAKLFELYVRGRPLKKAIVNFVRNVDCERKPTNDELEAACTVCPICHDSYSSPIILECGHIFCDDCVNTWFKREQTCPMCRAKVSENPTWQDGATTYFYQLF